MPVFAQPLAGKVQDERRCAVDVLFPLLFALEGAALEGDGLRVLRDGVFFQRAQVVQGVFYAEPQFVRRQQAAFA